MDRSELQGPKTGYTSFREEHGAYLPDIQPSQHHLGLLRAVLEFFLQPSRYTFRLHRSEPNGTLGSLTPGRIS